jgi:hypothetical protein
MTSIRTLLLFLGPAFLLMSNAPGIAQPLTVLPLEKPRVVVLTDITNEPDDQQSLVRYLVYANEFDTEALIATTSTHLRNRVRPDKIAELVEAYGQIRDNLALHAPGFPTAEDLLGRVTSHLPLYGMEGVGEGKSSDGSRRIIEVVDRDDPRPVWVTVWGGANCLAQALWDVRATRTPEEVDRFVSKIRVYTISDQDDTGHWMRAEFPGLFYIVSPSDTGAGMYHQSTWSGIGGDRFYRNGPMHHFEMVDNPWLEEHIMRDHGPLGALYPHVEYIMEGDTPSFLGLIHNGLGSALSPAYGGWGGRYQLYKWHGEMRPIWTNTRDSRDEVVAQDGRTVVSDQATIWRWRPAYQSDFAARMDWCIKSRDEANHNPNLVVNGIAGTDVLRLATTSAQPVVLSAAASSDPDGDGLHFRWFVYREAGTIGEAVRLEGTDGPEVRFQAPAVNRAGEFHIILEVQDDGDPPLTSYRRIIVAVSPGG